jgi:hypothetical protein
MEVKVHADQWLDPYRVVASGIGLKRTAGSRAIIRGVTVNYARFLASYRRGAHMLLRTAVFTLGLAPTVALAAGAMQPNDIKTTFFNGEPFTAATPSGTKFKMTFTPDGKALREPMGSAGGPAKSGTWKLSPAGFCTSWAGAKPSCFTLVPMSDNRWSVQRVATTISVSVAIWSKQ